jgi:hypothetical protein
MASMVLLQEGAAALHGHVVLLQAEGVGAPREGVVVLHTGVDLPGMLSVTGDGRRRHARMGEEERWGGISNSRLLHLRSLDGFSDDLRIGFFGHAAMVAVVREFREDDIVSSSSWLFCFWKGFCGEH